MPNKRGRETFSVVFFRLDLAAEVTRFDAIVTIGTDALAHV